MLTCFFSNSWNPKKGENWLVLVLTCFSQTRASQNGENGLVLVLTCFFPQTFGVDMFFSNSCKSKNWENWLVLVLTDWNLEPRSPKYRKIMTGDFKLLPKPSKWVRFYLLGMFVWKKPGHSKFQTVNIYTVEDQQLEYGKIQLPCLTRVQDIYLFSYVVETF